MGIDMGIDMGSAAAAGHSSSKNGAPFAGMKPAGAYALKNNIASKMLVNTFDLLDLEL